jgi:LysR family transcriptional regulator for metE and metH
MAVLPPDHVLRSRKYLKPADFAQQTIITYPVPEARIDLIQRVLAPAGIVVERRTAELTIAIMQLVASRRGLAALPSWGIGSYLEHEYVIAKPIGTKGLWSELHATGKPDLLSRPYAVDLVNIIRETCAAHLAGIRLLP